MRAWVGAKDSGPATYNLTRVLLCCSFRFQARLCWVKSLDSTHCMLGIECVSLWGHLVIGALRDMQNMCALHMQSPLFASCWRMPIMRAPQW